MFASLDFEELTFIVRRKISEGHIHLIFLIYCCAGWGLHCGIHIHFGNVSNISYLNSSTPPLSFIPLSYHSWKFSTGMIFEFTYMCTQVLRNFHPVLPFLPPPASHWCQLCSSHTAPPHKISSDLLFFGFVEQRKKMTLLLVCDKNSYTGIFACIPY
jgi:hypothetical protein